MRVKAWIGPLSFEPGYRSQGTLVIVDVDDEPETMILCTSRECREITG